MKEKFMILSYPRTGSTLLNDVLNKHTDIRCRGEIFIPSISCRYPDEWMSKYSIHGRYYEIQEFINGFYESYKEQCVGFKYILGTWNWEYEDMVKHEFGFPQEMLDLDVKKIVMNRDNVLQAAVSYYIAYTTNQWVAFDRRDIKEEKFEMDIERLKYHAKFFKEKHEAWVKYLKETNQEFVELKYEDIGLNTVNRVLDYLNQYKFTEFNTSHVKINGEKRYSNILNRDEINKELAEYGRI